MFMCVGLVNVCVCGLGCVYAVPFLAVWGPYARYYAADLDRNPPRTTGRRGGEVRDRNPPWTYDRRGGGGGMRDRNTPRTYDRRGGGGPWCSLGGPWWQRGPMHPHSPHIARNGSVCMCACMRLTVCIHILI